MKYQNRKIVTVTAAMFILGMSTAIATPRIGADFELYKGGDAAAAGVRFASWGSGTTAESGEFVYKGTKSLKMTTHGFYQGARIVMSTPIDIKPALSEPLAYLIMVYQIAERTGAGSIGGGFGGGPGGPGGGRLGPGGGGFGSKGGPGGGEGGGLGSGTSKPSKPKPIANIRLMLVTTDNKRCEAILPIENATTAEGEWKSVALPISTLQGIKESSGVISEVQVFADSSGVIFVGQVVVRKDDNPIRVEPLNEQTVAKNDTLTFTASVEAGFTPLKFEWVVKGSPTKDSGSDSQVDANYEVIGSGRTFKHKFYKSGDYIVSIKVYDAAGLKKPAIQSCKIHVTL